MKKFLLLSHDSGVPGGPVDKLYEYLKQNNTVYRIRHPIFPSSKTQSFLDFKTKEIRFKIPFLQFLLEGIITLFYLLVNRKRISHVDVVVCFDPLTFIDLFFYKFVLGIDKTIFYNLDYSKKRFNNRILNFIYKSAFVIALQNCDYFFSLRDHILKTIDPSGKYKTKSFIVGQTCSLHVPQSKTTSNIIIYAGALGKSIDFKPVLFALQKLKKENIQFILDIYGGINDNPGLIEEIKDLKLEENINIKKPLPVSVITTEIIPQYKIGIAPYMVIGQKDAPDYLFQGELLATKIVDYIAAGLPVVATPINPAFKDIETNHFGYTAEKSEDWYKSLKKLLVDDKAYQLCKQNAKVYSLRFHPKNVFDSIFNKIV